MLVHEKHVLQAQYNMLPIHIARHDSESSEVHVPSEREDDDELSRSLYSSSEEISRALKRRRVHRRSSEQGNSFDEEKFLALLRDAPEEIEMSLKERALEIETKKEKLEWEKAEREFEREMRRQSLEHQKAQTAVMQLILEKFGGSSSSSST